MLELLIGCAIGFAGGFITAWLFTVSIKKEIATLSAKLDGFLASLSR